MSARLQDLRNAHDSHDLTSVMAILHQMTIESEDPIPFSLDNVDDVIDDGAACFETPTTSMYDDSAFSSEGMPNLNSQAEMSPEVEVVDLAAEASDAEQTEAVEAADWTELAAAEAAEMAAEAEVAEVAEMEDALFAAAIEASMVEQRRDSFVL